MYASIDAARNRLESLAPATFSLRHIREDVYGPFPRVEHHEMFNIYEGRRLVVSAFTLNDAIQSLEKKIDPAMLSDEAAATLAR